MEKMITKYERNKSGTIYFEMRKPAETMEEYEQLEKEFKELENKNA